MSKVQKKKRTKSSVWEYFLKIDSASARCKLCTQILKHGGNTTNLMQHYKRKHNELENLSQEALPSTSQQNLQNFIVRMDLDDPDDLAEEILPQNSEKTNNGSDNVRFSHFLWH